VFQGTRGKIENKTHKGFNLFVKKQMALVVGNDRNIVVAQVRTYRCKDLLFETQEDDSSCGQIAIRNGLRRAGRFDETTQAELISELCKTRRRHPDGFRGTKPECLHRTIHRFWPSVQRVTGKRECLRLLQEGGPGAPEGPEGKSRFIIYHKWTGENRWHYVFVHKYRGHYHIENMYHRQSVTWNDKSKEEIFGEEGVHPQCNVRHPQMWALGP
jgi:hypothetical protein